jgi:hypothetical protein
MSDTRSVQERYAPENRCFGCGPANPQGLRTAALHLMRQSGSGTPAYHRW